ncbi:MAG: hypothetical protein AAB575_03815 [Patescibacteria group bacterium]
MEKNLKLALFILSIILLCAITFLLGLYIGKTRLLTDKVNQAKTELMKDTALKLKNLPFANIMEAMPGDLIFGFIEQKDGSQIKLTAEPGTIEELLSEQKINYTINITPTTKIYYLKINDRLIGNVNSTLEDIFEENIISVDELQVGEKIAIKIKNEDKSNPSVDALEIKVSR